VRSIFDYWRIMKAQNQSVGLSVVIPALNEEGCIQEVLERLKTTSDEIVDKYNRIDRIEIIVVDDESTDRTAEIAASIEGVRVISLEKNRGYGGALKEGFKQAKGDWLAFLDADGTYPPEFLSNLVEEMINEDPDIILGSRMVSDKTGMPLIRKAGNLFFAYLLSWLTGIKITDTASGMRIFKRETLDKLDKLPDGLNLTPVMSTSALHNRLDIREIPMPYDERVGASKLNPVTDGLRFLFSILGTTLRYNPLKIFGTLGILLCLAGAALGLLPIMIYLNTGRVEDWEIYRVLTVTVLEVSGVNLIFFGVVCNIVMSRIHRMDPFRNSILGRLLLKPLFLKSIWIIGAILMIFAVVLNSEGLYTFLTIGKVYIHWSYTVTGAFFFMLGLALVLWGSLVNMIEGIEKYESERVN
jgi:glycosyltransferase involved in cell wall biosynthesis